MTPAIAEALMFSGISPPQSMPAKVACPWCSHARQKNTERCMKIRYHPDQSAVSWVCYHCGINDQSQVTE